MVSAVTSIQSEDMVCCTIDYASVRMRKRGIRLCVCVCRQFVDLQNNALFSSYLLGMPLQPFQKSACVAKLVHQVLLLYLVVSSALER